MTKDKKLYVNIISRKFTEFLPPRGFLHNDNACHALFYYAMMAKKNYEEMIDTMQYEHETRENDYDFRQLFSSIALMYGVTPERMVNFWPNVDMQLTIMGSSGIPEGLKFKTVPEIRTQ